MEKLALLGEGYPAQLRENPQALRDFEVVWVGSSLEEFQARVPALKPHVLGLDVVDLDRTPESLLLRLVETSGARHSIITYRFARRAQLSGLASKTVRLLQGPISLSLLRAHLHMAMLDDLLPGRSSAAAPARTPAAPKPPRFSAEQLGRLMEIASTVQCECPNQLAQLVSGLRAFEDYSKACENRDDKDREIHALLYRQTAIAREGLEEALVSLMKHENIRL